VPLLDRFWPFFFPDFPKLGDSRDFAIIGVNASFAGPALIAISKPPPGVACPLFSSFKFGAAFNLVDSGGTQVFTPVPANQIDPLPGQQAGFAVARNGTLPSNRLWFFKVTKDPSGNPNFGSARRLTVPQYDIPPGAAQPLVSQKLATRFADMTQAVMAFNPRTKKHEFWTQHTIRSPNNPALSAVRYYEIDPLPSSPVLLNTNVIFSTFAGAPSYSTALSHPTECGLATQRHLAIAL
jgi:hypothetical protein